MLVTLRAFLGQKFYALHCRKENSVSRAHHQVVEKEARMPQIRSLRRFYDSDPPRTQISPFATLSAMLVTSMLPGWICELRQQWSGGLQSVI